MRRPYGRFTNKLKRNALFCATANSPDAISDTYGNRRIIPVALRSINWEKYNAVDKTEFWMSVYDLAHNKDYKHIVVGEDIEKLKKMSSMFVAADPVEELLLSYFRPKADGAYQHYREMTNTEILNMLQINSTFRALSGKRLAEYLRVYKFDSLRERNSNLKKYIVYQKELPYGGSEISEETHFKPF
jgi:predicted P-loop ATPase